MRARTFARLGTALAGAAISALAFAGDRPGRRFRDDHGSATTSTRPCSDTRATGHYEVQGSGLHIWTEGSTGTDKVAEYVDTSTPLADVGEPSLNYTTTSGTIPPGYQLVVDFDGDGTHDGILVGEPTFYGNNWWLNNAADADVKAGAPHTGGGSAATWYGTLDEWRASFPNAVVRRSASRWAPGSRVTA